MIHQTTQLVTIQNDLTPQSITLKTVDNNTITLNSEVHKLSTVNHHLGNDNILHSQSLGTIYNDLHIIDLWLSHKKKSTRKTYLSSIKQFFVFVQKDLKNVFENDLFSFKVYCENEKGFKPNTVKTKLMVVKSLLSYAHKKGYLSINNGTDKNLNVVIHNELENRFLTLDTVKLLIENAHSLRDKLIIKLASNYGLRISEIASITFDNLSTDMILYVYGKGNKKRPIRLKESMYYELLSLKRGNTHIFASKSQKKLTTMAIHKMFKQVVKRAKLDPRAINNPQLKTNITFHFLRHTMASLALKNGASLELIKETLGHSSIETTSRYLHINQKISIGDFVTVN